MFTHYFRIRRRGGVQRRRSPLLERLLARADSVTPVTDWRADAFRLIAAPAATMPAVGPAALYAELGALDARGARDAWDVRDAASVYIATPVHYLAEMSNVRLPADGILSLRRPEAEELAADFNRVWNDAGIHLRAGRFDGLLCSADSALQAMTHDPEEVLDQPIENYLPADGGAGGGAAAARLRRLMSEIEMWLFEHPVNRRRLAAESPSPVVNGLWLWGGGPALESLPEIVGWTAGNDPLFNAFATRRDAPASGVVVIDAEPGAAEWGAIEPWLESSVADLRSGRIARLDLSAGNRCFGIGSRGRLKFWRRSRPWWETFA